MEFNEQLEELGDIDQTEVDNGELEETAIQRIHSEKSEIGIDYDSGEDKLRSLSSDTQDLIQPKPKNPILETPSRFVFDDDVDEEPLPTTKTNCLSIQPDGNSLIYGHIGRITTVCQLSDGSLASGSDFPDKSIRIWSCPSAAEQSSTCEQVIKCPHKILSLLALPNNRIAAGLGNKTIRVFNTVTGALMTDWHSGPAHCLILLPGSNILSSSGDNSMKIWRRHDGAWLGTLRGHNDAVTCCAVVPEKSMIVSGSKDATIKLWQLTGSNNDADCMQTLTGHSSAVTSVCITNTGLLLSSSLNEIKLWNTSSFACIATFDEHSANLALTIAPTLCENQVVLIGFGTAKDHSTLAKILDIITGKIVKEVKDPEQSKSKEKIFCVSVLQDGRMIVAGEDKVLRILLQ